MTGNEQLREFMDKLTVSNVSQYVDLPMIAVLGDTSSGKSSLLTAISMVELPSSEKLTTRCPIMLRMKRSDKRSANVTVEWKGNDDSGLPFHEKISEKSWSKLTHCIAGAQEHIMTTRAKKTGRAKKNINAVARDIVSVEVNGPHCEDLTLIDLPGIVRSTGAGESETLVEDIQALLRLYLENERCVILAVQPANVDFHNSQIMADAKEVDPGTSRTLPVITKPDLIDPGAEEGVKDLLLGRKTEKFEQGFHIVKCRGQKALNDKVPIEKSLEQEHTFFSQQAPWSKVSDRSLFGIKNLRKKLCNLQIQMVRKSFSTIIKEISQQKLEAEEGLHELGTICESLSDKRFKFMEAIRKLRAAVEKSLVGSEEPPRKRAKPAAMMSISSHFHVKCGDFQSALREGRLVKVDKLSAGTDVLVTKGRHEFHGKLVSISGKFGYVDIKDFGDSGMGDAFRQKNAGKSKAAAGSVAVKGCQVQHTLGDGNYDVLHPLPLDSIRPDPTWLKEIIQRSRPMEQLPVFVNAAVFKSIVVKFIQEDWEGHCYDLLDLHAKLLKEVTNKFVENDSTLCRYPRFVHFLKDRIFSVVKKLEGEAKYQLKTYISQEKSPYTQNDYLTEELNRLRSKPLEKALIEALDVRSTEPPCAEAISKTSVKSTIEAVFRQNREKSVDDHVAEDTMNILRAYGKVAFKRFIDKIPLICQKMIVDFPGEMERELWSISETELDTKMTEDPSSVSRFKMLQEKVQTLSKALCDLKELV